MKTFDLLGEEIEVDIDLQNYSIIRSHYRKIGEAMCEGFADFWREHCDNIHSVVVACPKYFEYVVTFLVKEGHSRLVARDIYDVSEQSFYEEYENEYFSTSFFDDTLRKYECIMRAKDQSYSLAEEERRYNSTSSSRWEGGGFGISGAIKGSIIAGGMNFVGDMIAESKASRAYNKQISQLDSAFNKKFNELYNNQLYEHILNGIWKLCMNGMYAYLDELSDHDMFDYPDIDREKAGIIFDNVMQYGKGDKIVKNLIECIRLYPYEEDYFIKLYNMKDLDDKDAITIEEMVEFFCIEDSFNASTDQLRIERQQMRFLKLIEDTKDATIIEKALVIKRFLAEAFCDSNFYKKKNLNKIVKFVDGEVKAISEEILENSKGTNIKEKLNGYCNKQNVSKENKQNLLVVLQCAEIIEKAPFFLNSEDEECNLELGAFMDLLERIEALFKIMEEEVKYAIPGTLKLLFNNYLLKQWITNVYTVEKVDCFKKAHDKFNKLFDDEVIKSELISKRKKEAADIGKKLYELKEKYDKILAGEQAINSTVFETFIKEFSKRKLDKTPSPEAREYKQQIAEAFTKDCESKSITELFELHQMLFKYKEDDAAENVRGIYLSKLAANYSIIKTKYDGKYDGLLIVEDLSKRNIKYSVSEVKQQIESFYGNLKNRKGYYSEKSDLFDARVKKISSNCDIEVNEEDVYALYTMEKTCFLITAEGFVCGKDLSVNHLKYSASYLKYTDLKEVVSDKDGNIYLIHKETNEKILLLKIKEINETKELIDFISKFLIYI